ncbi:Receptor-type tyrosine-protein phosphatase gamma [Trichinella spiralis]|uniref:Receptor-type tyrosine-protein phosphatase gamma n=1 Tax=Trichinella spiralis TaxID=6334 RepID=A0ABR3KZT1_TRISP
MLNKQILCRCAILIVSICYTGIAAKYKNWSILPLGSYLWAEILTSVRKCSVLAGKTDADVATTKATGDSKVQGNENLALNDAEEGADEDEEEEGEGEEGEEEGEEEADEDEEGKEKSPKAKKDKKAKTAKKKSKTKKKTGKAGKKKKVQKATKKAAKKVTKKIGKK